MIVILAEKASAARNFAAALGGMQGRYNGEEYSIVHAVGHLYGFPKDTALLVDQSLARKYTEWKMENMPWDPNDFHWIIRPLPKTKDAIDRIRTALQDADEVVIATDNDPSGEGDLLAWEILIALRWSGKTTRMHFADESSKQVRKAFESRFPVESAAKSGAFLKANARSKFDYLSMQLTRIASLQAKERGHRMLLRQGRLKSVMVYLIGYQLELVKNYKKIPFYEARYRDENGHVYKRKESDDIRFPAKEQVDLTQFEDSDVVHDITERKSTQPGKLLDLAALTATLVRKYGCDAKKVLEVYQKMYERSIVSYPRTEDKKITEEQFEELKERRFDIADVVGVDHSLLTHDTLRKKHFQESAAHGANRPGSNVPGSLQEIEKEFGKIGSAIYEVLARNALAIFGEDYIYDHQTGHIEKHPEFIGTANLPVSPGFKQIFSSEEEKEDEEEKENELPLGKNASSFIYEGANPKPKKPTMSWLVEGDDCMLSKYNVGTGATRTSTLVDITDASDPSKQLVQMSKKGALTLTPVGEVSFILLNGCYIASPKITEHLLQQMDEVGEFQRPPEKVINSITPIVIHDLVQMKKNAENIPQGHDAFKDRVRDAVYEPTGETISFNREWGRHSFSDEEVRMLLRGESVSFSDTSRSGKEYTVTGTLQKQKYKGKEYWGFQQAGDIYEPTGENIVFKKEWGGHVFSEAEISSLLKGETISFRTTSKEGREYEAKGSLQKQKYKGREFWGFQQAEREFPPDRWCGHVFTDNELADLLAGVPIRIDDAVSKRTGKTFSCSLTWEKGKLNAKFDDDKKKKKKGAK